MNYLEYLIASKPQTVAMHLCHIDTSPQELSGARYYAKKYQWQWTLICTEYARMTH